MAHHKTATPALKSLDVTARSETEGHVDDTKVVEPQPAKYATDELPHDLFSCCRRNRILEA
jgi:hypothetical protein